MVTHRQPSRASTWTRVACSLQELLGTCAQSLASGASAHTTSWKPTTQTGTQFTPHTDILQHKQEPSSHHILKAYNTNRNPVHTTSWKPTTQTGTQFTPHPESLQHKQAHNSHHILKAIMDITSHTHHTFKDFRHTTSWMFSCTHLKAFTHTS